MIPDVDDVMAAADPVATAATDGQRILVGEVLGAALDVGLLNVDKVMPSDVDAVLKVMRGARQ